MSKPIKSEGPKKVVKLHTPDDVKEIIRKYRAESDPRKVLERTGKLLDTYRDPQKPNTAEIEEELAAKLDETVGILALENHYVIAETVNSKRTRTMMIELANQIVEEYQCSTTSEVMLAETAAWSYGRMIEFSAWMSSAGRTEYADRDKNGFYSMISREVDRACRQYLNAISTLKRFKQPPVQLTLKADTAFVAQNQQVNNPSPPIEVQDNGPQ